jgi:hypothetical protein
MKYKYLNSGGIYGTFDAFVRALKVAESYKVSDDQWCWTKAWLDGKIELELDYECRIFQSLYRSEEDMDYSGSRIRNRLTSSEPCVFHGNGGADMSGVLTHLFERDLVIGSNDPTKLAVEWSEHGFANVARSWSEVDSSFATRGAKLPSRRNNRKATPPGFLPSCKTLMQQAVPAFGITVDDEGPEVLIQCLRSVRSVYPRAPIFVISDGWEDAAFPAVCRTHNATYHLGSRLKLLEHGAEWWQRFFLHAAKEDSDFVIKIDPDTMLHTRLHSYPPLEVFGRLDGAIIQGDIQGFSAAGISRISSSGICRDPMYRDYRTWAFDATSRQQAISKGQIAPDYVLFDIAHRLRLRYGSWSEVNSSSKA